MRSIYVMLAAGICIIALAFAGIFLIGLAYGGSSRTTVSIADDERDYTLSASYPLGKSLVIGTYIDNWASKAVNRSGSLKEQLHLKFSDGSVCSVHAAGRELEIVARRSENDPAKLARFKQEFKNIKDFIVLQVSAPKKQ
jgi:hypothetical protein